MHYLPRGTFLAPLAGPLGRLPPKCETQSGTDCRPFANFSKIRSAVSEEMHHKQQSQCCVLPRGKIVDIYGFAPDETGIFTPRFTASENNNNNT